MAHGLIENEDYVIWRTEANNRHGAKFWNQAEPWWKSNSDISSKWQRYGEAIDDLDGNTDIDTLIARARHDFQVEKEDLFTADGEKIKDFKALRRINKDDTKQTFGVVGSGWHPTQNRTGWEYILPFLKNSSAKLDTAGTTQGGRLAWIAVRLADSFAVCSGQDVTDLYLLFAISHKSGTANHAKIVANRTVCGNTWNLNVGAHSKQWFRWDHTKPFNADAANVALDIVRDTFRAEKEVAEALINAPLRGENIVDFFKRSFNLTDPDKNDEKRDEKFERNQKIIDTLTSSYHTQPGVEFGRGSIWQAFNAVTNYVDNIAGNNAQLGFASSQFGNGNAIKSRARANAIQLIAA